MNLKKTFFDNVLVIALDQNPFKDSSLISYDVKDLINLGIGYNFVQENQSLSKVGVLRGIHYQTNFPQGKLIQVLKGSIFDVIVDLRSFSLTFGKTVNYELRADSLELMWIPPGYAHGFYTLEEDTIILYKVTEFRYPEFEKTLLWNDEFLNIPWPLNGKSPIISEKDMLGEKWENINYFNKKI